MRAAPDRERIAEWALVLASAGIAHRVERVADGWCLLVAARDEQPAALVLDAYDAERPAGRVPEPPEHGTTAAGLVSAGLLVAFYLVTGPRDAASVWFRRGSAAADLIARGEVWRTVTALTLHADAGHVVGNALGCALFVTAVCRSLGPGLGSWLVLLSGAAGNAITALAVHGAGRSAVGASTAIFGAVGILGSLAFARRRRRGARNPRAWLALAASLALLGMLGTSEGADLPSHLFGLLAGGAAGTVTALAIGRPPGAAIQSALALAGLALVGGCWLLALKG